MLTKNLLVSMPLLFLGCQGTSEKPRTAESPAPDKPAANQIEKVKTAGVGLDSAPAPQWTQLQGELDASKEWGSGWLDLDVPRSFATGTFIRVQVGGSAKTIALRLLPVGANPNANVGVVGQYTVKDGAVEAKLSADYRETKQISVHGMNAWNVFGDKHNGPATLMRVEIKEPSARRHD